MCTDVIEFDCFFLIKTTFLPTCEFHFSPFNKANKNPCQTLSTKQYPAFGHTSLLYAEYSIRPNNSLSYTVQSSVHYLCLDNTFEVQILSEKGPEM